MNPNQLKIAKLSKIMETITKADSQEVIVVKEKLIAIICVDWGLARRTVLEYIDNLVKAGRLRQFKRDGNTILELDKGERQFSFKPFEK